MVSPVTPNLNYTITLQAASDSVMTVNNVSNGTALGDDDCRKMYGLPHMFFASGYMRNRNGVYVGDAAGRDGDGNAMFWGKQFIINDSRSMISGLLSGGDDTLRWDLVSPQSVDAWRAADHSRIDSDSYALTAGYGPGDTSVTGLYGQQGANTAGGVRLYPVDRRPTTTAFQLRCESIQHSIQDMSTITALPGIDYGTSGRTGTPEQLDNISVAFGMRKETITLNGIMIDRGVISAYNPRRQVILDIARSQYLKIRNTAPIPDVEEKKDDDKVASVPRGVKTQWGGAVAGPMTPRSYPCLTIFGQGYDTDDAGDAAGGGGVGLKGDVEADGGYRIYRGIIKNLSWTMEPGRPDFWRWKMTFECISNEKRGMSMIHDASDTQGRDGEDTGE